MRNQSTRWHRCAWCHSFYAGQERSPEAPPGVPRDLKLDGYCLECIQEIDRSTLGEEVVILISTDVAEELAEPLRELQAAYPAASIEVNDQVPSGVWKLFVEATGPYSEPCMMSIERHARKRLESLIGVFPCPTR